MKNSVYDEIPETYSELRRGWMFDEKIRIVSQLIKEFGIKSFLDFGCGTGDFLKAIAKSFPNVDFVGYDLNETYIKHASVDPILPNLSFSTNFDSLLSYRFDLCYVNDVIHHFPTEQDFFSVVRRSNITKIAVLEPNQFNPYVAYMQSTMPGERNFRQENFKIAASEAGFEVIREGRKFAFPNSLKNLNAFARKVNSLIEGNFFFGGAVFYLLVRK